MPPPPPPKRIKRPPKVLDEEEYTSALSNIIARDFFPGLLESEAQQEYLTALESNDPTWITSAGQKLREAMTPRAGRRRARATRLDPSATPRPYQTPAYGRDTPKNWGGTTPSVAGTELSEAQSEAGRNNIDTTDLSLSAFQQKYTSEDNESFNALLDKQNAKKREKYAFLWNDNKIPAPRQLLHRAREAKLLTQRSKSDSSGENNALIPITTGATSSRPAQPTAWEKPTPNNAFMFAPPSIEDDYETVAQKKDSQSRAAPKQTVYTNTRLPTPAPPPQDSVPPSPSLTAARDAIAGRPRLSTSELGTDIYNGAETPRVNGYAFVDEDEPEPIPQLSTQATEETPSYRDLLAGQFSNGTNPFKISESSKRESLHHRLVEKTAKQNREKRKETIKTPVPAGGKNPAIPKFPSSPMILLPTAGVNASGQDKAGTGNMTPAARKLMERIGGRTPRPGSDDEEKKGKMTRNMWTPTPKRKSMLRK